jgi:hypothetical protein
MKDKKSKPLNFEKPASPPENQSTTTDNKEDDQVATSAALDDNKYTSEPELKSS